MSSRLRRQLRWLSDGVRRAGKNAVRGDFRSVRRSVLLLWLKRTRPLFDSATGSPSKCLSSLPLDVFIPALPGTLPALYHTVLGVRQNVRHPLRGIYIVAPNHMAMKEFCEKYDCIFVDEDCLLPISKRDISYAPQGIDRSGWIFQQLLKFSFDEVTAEDNCLIVDSDTVFVRPQVFEKKGKTVVNLSDEYHLPYFEAYKKLLGEKPRSCASFVSHHMLFQKDVIRNLKRVIEIKNGQPWYEAILSSFDRYEMSAFSEYETYGNFLVSRYKRRVRREYWYNRPFPPGAIRQVDNIVRSSRATCKSVSFHSYEPQ